MTSTRMTLDAEQRSRVAVPHDQGRPAEIWEDTVLAGAGSFLSTANDMLKFVGAHFDPHGPLHPSL
jgi:hypothetical protein